VKRGDGVRFTLPLLRDVRGRVVRMSKITGSVTVELTSTSPHVPAYRIGDRVNVKPYELVIEKGGGA
jgi:hypothetical protein